MNTPDPVSDDPFGTEPPGPDLEAAEYALGVQDAEQRRRSQARIRADAAFAAQVAAWEDRLAGLFAGVTPRDRTAASSGPVFAGVWAGRQSSVRVAVSGRASDSGARRPRQGSSRRRRSRS